LNFAPNQTVADLVFARVGSGGRIRIFNNAGNVDVLADVVGWYDMGSTSTRYTPVTPTRLLDTRTGNGTASVGKVQGGGILPLSVLGRSPVPASHVSAVALNVTATNTSSPSHVTVWPSGEAMPGVSNINFACCTTMPNLVVAKLGSDGKVNLFNNQGSIDLLA